VGLFPSDKLQGRTSGYVQFDTENAIATVFTSVFSNGNWNRQSQSIEVDRKVLLDCSRLLIGPLLLAKGKRPNWDLMLPPGKWDGELPDHYLAGFFVPVQVEGISGWLDWSSPSAYLKPLIERLYACWEEQGSQSPLTTVFGGFETRFNTNRQRDYYVPILEPGSGTFDNLAAPLRGSARTSKQPASPPLIDDEIPW
jgi:hypothetical protein